MERKLGHILREAGITLLGGSDFPDSHDNGPLQSLSVALVDKVKLLRGSQTISNHGQETISVKAD